ncbi:MAG TPA: hypothetical protein PKZ07_14000 [Sedimentisphaerales bacterium]|nr:hypothetical protein [Sedimentisphaerales bacterium]
MRLWLVCVLFSLLVVGPSDPTGAQDLQSPWSDPPIQEYGIQLARTDPYTPQETVRLFNLIKNSVIADPNVKAYYFPTYEQYPMVQQNRDWLQAQGVPVGSTAQRTLDELRARNVRLVYFTTGARECRPTEKEDTPPMIRLLGFDEPIE